MPCPIPCATSDLPDYIQIISHFRSSRFYTYEYTIFNIYMKIFTGIIFSNRCKVIGFTSSLFTIAIVKICYSLN